MSSTKPEKARCCFCLTSAHASYDHVNKTTRGPRDWLECGDTGTSSEAILMHMTGVPRPAPAIAHEYPMDPADFGRCYRLLHAPWALDWRARIGEMAQYGKVWAEFVTCWDKFEALYLEAVPTGRAPKLYALMHAIRAPHER